MPILNAEFWILDFEIVYLFQAESFTILIIF